MLEKCVVYLTKIKMNILSWNVRGAVRKRFSSQLKEIIKYCNPGIVLLLETKGKPGKARKLLKLSIIY